jgi:hypothetical protein
VEVRQLFLLLLDLAAVEVMGSFFGDPQRFTYLGHVSGPTSRRPHVPM